MTAAYMPLWTYLNAQFAVSRTGGDTVMGIVTDVFINVFAVLPGMVLLTFFTSLGPVSMYALVKTTDFAKVFIAHSWLKKERWVKNLAAKENLL